MGYLKTARRQAVLSALLEYGKNTFLPTDLNVEPSVRLLCEDLPIKHAEIPQEEVYEALKWLQVRVNRLEKKKQAMELAEFEDFDDDGPDDDFDYEEDDEDEEKERASGSGQEEHGAEGAKGKEAPAKGNAVRGGGGKRPQAPS